MTIISSLSLKELTTFRVGGKARFFCTIKNLNDLKEALDFAKEKDLKIFILGGGSNILVRDEGFHGLVIKMEISGIEFTEIENKDAVLVKAGAGENWDDFVKKTVEKGLYGLENLSYIPGTVGASPVQNIGAYGSEVKDTIHSVEVFDIKDGTIKEFKNSDCDFSYRDSIFKKEKGRYVVLNVSFILSKNGKVNIEYKDLKEYFLNNKEKLPSLKNVRNAVIKIRKAKLPDIKEIGTAGSFFKNPIVNKEKAEELMRSWPDIPIYPYSDTSVKVSLAWIIDKICGYKGVEKGDVGTYKNQALVIVNKGNASFKDIENFANEIINKVKEKTGIIAQSEVEWV